MLRLPAWAYVKGQTVNRDWPARVNAFRGCVFVADILHALDLHVGHFEHQARGPARHEARR